MVIAFSHLCCCKVPKMNYFRIHGLIHWLSFATFRSLAWIKSILACVKVTVFTKSTHSPSIVSDDSFSNWTFIIKPFVHIKMIKKRSKLLEIH